MPLPLIPVVLFGVGVVTGAGGVTLGAKGAYEIMKANGRIQKAGAAYELERRALEAHELVTNAALQVLGGRQEDANRLVVERMARFLIRNEKQVSESEKLLVEGLESTSGQVKLEAGLGQDPVSWMRGIAGSTVAGVGINTGVTTAVTSLATASTGTAISSLSGAAATNATMAAIGGGSVATGGGGMAVGAAALNFVTIGPALLVSGFMVAGQGERAKTKAQENEAQINVSIAGMEETKAKFDAIVARAEELGDLLAELADRGTSALELLESEPFDPSVHATRFQHALTLTIAVRDVAATQVVEDDGSLNQQATAIKIKYRALMREIDNG